jgi:hypothetical protein
LVLGIRFFRAEPSMRGLLCHDGWFEALCLEVAGHHHHRMARTGENLARDDGIEQPTVVLAEVGQRLPAVLPRVMTLAGCRRDEGRDLAGIDGDDEAKDVVAIGGG